MSSSFWVHPYNSLIKTDMGACNAATDPDAWICFTIFCCHLVRVWWDYRQQSSRIFHFSWAFQLYLKSQDSFYWSSKTCVKASVLQSFKDFMHNLHLPVYFGFSYFSKSKRLTNPRKLRRGKFSLRSPRTDEVSLCITCMEDMFKFCYLKACDTDAPSPATGSTIKEGSAETTWPCQSTAKAGHGGDEQEMWSNPKELDVEPPTPNVQQGPALS